MFFLPRAFAFDFAVVPYHSSATMFNSKYTIFPFTTALLQGMILSPFRGELERDRSEPPTAGWRCPGRDAPDNLAPQCSLYWVLCVFDIEINKVVRIKRRD